MPVMQEYVDGKWRNYTPGGVKSKGTTKKKADAQKNLLNALEHNPEFAEKLKKRKKGKK